MAKLTIDELANFCKRKGFVYPSGEIYGGGSGFWDFGPVGVEFKNNLKKEWWKFHVQEREDIVGIDGSIITNPKVWEASGHVGNFVDVAVVCTKCKTKSKVDKHELATAKCEKCNGKLDSRGEFNPMFTTQVGPIKEDSKLAYLRPETAQLIFTNFKLVQDNARLKLPFGIAQIGKSFRNEIAPRNFLFRSREFEQMEIEYFINPKKKNECPAKEEVGGIELQVLSSEMQENNEESKKITVKEAIQKKIFKLKWHGYWLATEISWFVSLGANPNNFRVRQHTKDEKSHYATDTWDIEYNFPFGWKELQGIADRGTYDLETHEKYSKKDLKIMDDDEKILPMVVAEPSLGVERAFLVFLFESYSKNEKENIVLKLHPKLAPTKVAIFPLIKKDAEQVKISRELYNLLKKEMNATYDESGSVGKRYARNDEIGTPFCLTVDSDSQKNKTVTIRSRDDGKQKIISIDETPRIIQDLISERIEFKKL
ncbi:glycine--tRNA ligase [archaeon]|nr:glycine--tRNA ligase [archaeon]MBT6182809.1 glycine--tRNA ligase [archaeon]MBT6606208.1 glycine--tRNA ligase [archaeon]MBT7251623.1 glycine--tRNA ligase [archaeon]MBT7661087.1 glycine--tRNA ligase [archaeon]